MITRFQPYFYLLKPVKWKFVGAILAGVVAGFVGLGLPLIINDVFPLIFKDEHTGETVAPPEWMLKIMDFFGYQSLDSHSMMLWACLMMPAVFVLRGVFGYINTYLINASGLYILERIRVKAYSRLQVLPLAFHQKHKEGDLLSRVISDANQVQTALTKIACDIIVQPATLLWALSALVLLALKQDGVLVVFASLVSVPVCVFPIKALGKKLYKKAKSLQKKSGAMTASISENLASQREVRAYNMERSQIEKFERDSNIFRHLRLKVVKYRYLVSPSIEIVSAIGIGFAIYFGSQQGMSQQAFMALIAAMFFAYDPIKKLGAISSSLRQAEASLDRLEEILNSEDNMDDSSTTAKLEEVVGEIKFENVHFFYEDDPALTAVNLTVPAGQTVALIGPSGAGKSTFVSLIPRFYEVSTGALRIDGSDIRDVTKYELRENIALVSQHPLLFSGTIAENILIGRAGASEQEMMESAKYANAHDFIMELPDGYNTVISERGEGLSGGQRQRIAIARAFLKDAPILILDEATSALDTESESQIQGALQQLAKGRTTFLIAHRFSSIRDAERILVFDKTEQGGQIIADGSHDELYVSCPLYKDLYDKQGV